MNSIKKRLLSACLAVLMVVGLMPTSALAEEDGAVAGSAVQIGNYYKVDDENGGKLNDSPTLAEGSTLKSYENGFVTINKTIEGTDTENEFIINLDVTTKSKIEQVEMSEDAAVVLVIDTSNSMVNNQGPKDSWYNRIEEAQKAAQAFINSFVEEDATRKIAIVKFSGNHQGQGVTGATVLQNWEDASVLKTDSERTFCDSLKGLKQDGGTNIEAGLILATNLLKVSELDDIKNKNIILLTDGQPTYGVDDTEAGSDNIKDICLRGEHMIGNGSASAFGYGSNDKLHEIHERVEAKVKSIQEAGIGTYAVFVGEAKLTCGEKNCLLNDDDDETSGEDWLKMAGFTAFAASDAENELTTIFEEISKIIEMQAKAWILKDPMGSNIQFKGFVNEGEDRVCGGEEITWNLRLADATETTEGDETVYQYSMSYNIKLDNLAKDFDETKYYATNGPTSLSYLLTTNNNGEETYKLGYAYANIPSVKGLEGSFFFNKVGSFGEVLPGAAFTLTSVEDASVNWTAVSDENGVVSFAGIPSGHAYTLSET
ncbi:MAG: VWA domain-containing protein, partial [Firmicutes bacterium]|nr:VWA domain-containing protein [Bacillota bacterium]